MQAIDNAWVLCYIHTVAGQEAAAHASERESPRHACGGEGALLCIVVVL